MHSTDIDSLPATIEVNPHNTDYKEETGPLCQPMSIIDKLRISLRFNMTARCNDRAETSTDTFTGDGIKHLKFLWRPIFFSFPEKLQAADDDTAATVETILGLTSDDTNGDVVPLTTNDLPVGGDSDTVQPMSTVNAAQVFGDFNLTTNTVMEDHVWDEDLFQNAIRRFTNKGALKSCVGRTRYVNLTESRPYKNYYIKQFVPKAVRRIVDRTFFAIQVHLPVSTDFSQDFHAISLTTAVAHLGIKLDCKYHEWNTEHDQDMTA